MKNNIFIIGLDDFQLRELQTIRTAPNDTFQPLLDYDTVVQPENLSFKELLERARTELREFDGSVDAVIAHWDFPSSVLAPILSAEHGIPSPTLESVLKCEHKYWSRVEQKRSVPDCIPDFSTFDPFDDDALNKITVDYPFWIKPVKSFASQLGFKIDNEADFRQAIAKIRVKISRIGNAFDEALTMVELPAEIADATGSTCIAEQIIGGVQAAPEGAMFQGRFSVHGVLDMPKDKAGKSFSRYEYPSALPREIQQRMIDASERFLRHIGFDNGCFNAEFMWDQDKDKLWLIEVNTRISQSHSDLFNKVDGMSNHEIAVDIALGREPSLPSNEGPFNVAAKCMIPHPEDGIVTKIPSAEEIKALQKRFPGTYVKIEVEPGTRLAELPNQDSYRYVLGTLFLGADSHEQLGEKYEECLKSLHFEFHAP